ncbi:MAG: hypothetical protein ABR562_08385 [Thermoplasmatota archaeon]|nr:hypothetical protein [Halobacteriales archaeon]
MKAWLAPLALGLVVAAATAALGPRLIDTRPPPDPPWKEAAARGYVLPFPATETGSLLVVAPDGHAAAESALRQDGEEAVAWETPNLGFLRPVATPCCGPAGPVPATVYVFRADGGLLGSNDGRAQVARFRLDANYVALPNATWSNGTLAATAGTLPDSLRPVLQALQVELAGLQAGSVGVAVVREYPHADALGPLYVTVRAGAAAAGSAAPA